MDESKQGSAMLVVEDDLDIQEAMADVLGEEGYEVRLANNGKDALAVLGGGPPQFRPRLILLDLMMPVMNGWTFRQAQLLDPKLADIPVVVVSADRNAHEQAKEMKAAAFLPKPVVLADLLDTLETFFSGQA